MFCNQCEQTAKGVACTKIGVCGKDHETDVLQDLLIYALQGLGKVAQAGRQVGIDEKNVNFFTCEALFATLTNVNFDQEAIKNYIFKAIELREQLKEKIKAKGGEAPEDGSAGFNPPKEHEALLKAAEQIEPRPETAKDPDIFSLKLTTIYSLKGIAAYQYHATKLGEEDPMVYEYMHRALATLESNELGLEDWVNMVLELGKVNLKVMELLDRANHKNFGVPKPTEVPLGHKAGKAILVSGHDLEDLYELLKQTEGKGIYVYTHGEMLPAHGYPELKKFEHFYGHYGTAWQNQQKEFPEFPGPIVMTTNCLMPPKEAYKDRVFTLGPVAFPGVKHISGHDFSEVIEMAQNMEGFKEDSNGRKVLTGFAHETVLSVADKVIEGVKSGAIKHFFLVGGCDGAKPGRNYYTRFVELTPKDTIVLTLGCGKFRFFDKDLGTIGDLPRLLDMGQCNDAYSAIQVALALAKAFNVDVNELPLSLIVSWYEQKAVAILLTLLYLGIKNIYLGPTLPAFLSPNVLKFLADKYDIKPISDPETDLKACLKG
ncbi:hybrid cluster protein [Thermodesulfatator indicus DSM 15286]|uniref:Hydroxylamine reductase n=1 Tax=Thermodesulfatator indicus (strain DSM 15286 / JCM 11887 / CIR29812) TaxID=667014 RepID=F8ADL4_THEID|nr:hydroxylamine reductase [Thermodesulfatator indicus]AEH44891.1 hybrid cluster protein [Thermodesulfatator indicus DSM 15286]